jgi:hypothetical protein
MAARMFRAIGSEVRNGKGGAVLETGGRLQGTSVGGHGYFVLSDVGAGVFPLYLVGTWSEIGPYLTSSGNGIKNLRVHHGEDGTEKMDEIWARAGAYRPGKNRGLFPALDVGTSIASTLVGFAGGAFTSLSSPDAVSVNVASDIGGGASDSVGLFQSLFGKKEGAPPPTRTSSISNSVDTRQRTLFFLATVRLG